MIPCLTENADKHLLNSGFLVNTGAFNWILCLQMEAKLCALQALQISQGNNGGHDKMRKQLTMAGKGALHSADSMRYFNCQRINVGFHRREGSQ